MPQVYRRHSDYNPRPSLVPRRRSSMVPAGPQPTDADDSIVLADLVRTGEASRLRRRGAMRLDHNPGAAGRPPPPPPSGTAGPGPSSYAPPVRPIIIEPSRTPSPEPGADEYTYSAGPVWRDWEGGGLARPPPQGRGAEGVQAVEILSETTQAGQGYVLHCGGEDASIEDDDEEDRPRRFEPSLFPDLSSLSSPPSRPSSSSRALGRFVRKTNGCGALVHVCAHPQRPRGVWMAKEDAAETVVGLDSAYCDHPAMDKMLKSACGCIREGIGCSVCGNTLGTRYVPCQAASESIFSPTLSNPPPPSSSRPLRPFGPSYWDARPPGHHRRSTSSTGSSRGHLPSYYTFFADRVTGCPPYDLPSHTAVAPVPVPPEQRREYARPTSPEIDYGYRWTASPQPAPTPLPPLPLPTSEPNTFRDRDRDEPPSPVFALPPLPPLSRNPSQLRPLSTSLPLSISVSSREPPPLVVSTPSGEPGLDLDPDGVPFVELDEPSSPDKESMSWPGR
ncbi:hypothetical protein LXA43DRAFT_882252 [Ganoderma leucocontextum]|nr:hypothetical protein LXA43DRAFT_882252 [Ganoderma leucocontextum]